MAAKLKNLFEIFASDLLEDMCEELKESPMELCKSGNKSCFLTSLFIFRNDCTARCDRQHGLVVVYRGVSEAVDGMTKEN